MGQGVGERAVELFGQGNNCAQAVLLAVAEKGEFTVDKLVASAFGGGMGRSGQTCGAVTGALMAIGLGYGEANSGEGDPRANVSDVARGFMEQFHCQYGSTDCRDLIEGTFATEKTPQTYSRETKERVCKELVRCAAEAANDLLRKEA